MLQNPHPNIWAPHMTVSTRSLRYVGQFMLTASDDGAELSIPKEGAEQLPPPLSCLKSLGPSTLRHAEARF